MFIWFQTQPERRRLEPKLNFRRLSSSRRVPGYLFCDAQRPKAICSVQVQVGLSPVDNLLQAFPFGVTFGNSREQKNGCMDVCVAPVGTTFALWTLVIIWILQGFKETCVRKREEFKTNKNYTFYKQKSIFSMNIVWKQFLLECLPGTEAWPSSWQGNTGQTDGA